MSFNLPNPSLLGILLVVSSHNGPQLVFDYPEDLSDVYSSSSDLNSSSDDSPDDNSEESQDEGDSYNSDHEKWDSHNFKYYLGNKQDIMSFLDKQEKVRRQFSVNKSQPNPGSIKSSDTSLHNSKSNSNKTIFGIEPDYLVDMLCPPKQMCNSRFEITIDDIVFLGLPIHKYENGSWRLNVKDKEEIKVSSLNMFHLVFVMDPPVIECNYRIDEMFHYVISRLSLVLRYEQSKSDFISNQVKLIFDLKEKFKNDKLHENLVNNSSLCKIIADCYSAISKSKIANLSIGNKLRSFQIPIKTEFHSLPEITVPYIPGSHLSSTVKLLGNTGLINIGETTRYDTDNVSNIYQLNDLEDSNTSADDIIYFALLLLDDAESIITDIKTESDSTLAKFIRTIKPTESMFKLSIRNPDLNIQQIQSFAFHLIYWRRARVIQPLSTRCVYIVSPMAPITINLFHDIQKFKLDFPTLPSLPQFLKLLSSPSKKPKQFAFIIPSKDHRDSYLSALSWLIRFGYVTQLQTFIWLKISRKIKIKVDEDLENESQSRKRSNTGKLISSGTDNTSKVESKSKVNDQDIENIEKALKAASIGPNIVLEDEDDTIIIDPGRATTLERKWINKLIIDECKLSKELTTIFYKLLKYMNGKNSLEHLLLKENLSRTELRRLLFALEDYIISVRHW